MSDRIFGHVDGHPPGTWYESREALSEAGVHRPRRAGIAGSQDEGADSVVLSGGYVDDEDHGDWILYAGQGGRDPDTGRQIKHQRLNRGNRALARSRLLGLPVRVIRGAGADSRWAPDEGYRYDGLYRVTLHWRARSADGPYVFRFRLDRIPGEGPDADPDNKGQDGVEQSTVRVVRETEAGRRLKRQYDFRCQVCGERMETPAGPYAETLHLKPLGRPHHGPDAPENLLCLCPNHHVLLRDGAFAIADDHSLVGRRGSVIVREDHPLSPECVRYHRERFWREGAE